MNYRLLFAILSTAFIEQAVITIVRVTTTYRAVELDLSVVWVGVITAVYAVLPIGIGVPFGRFVDRGYDAVTTWIGGGLLIVGCAGFVLFPNLAGILVATAIIGTAHLLFVVSQQSSMHAVRHRAGRDGTRHRQLHGRQCGGAGRRPLYRRACRRLGQRAADAVSVCHWSRRRGLDRGLSRS